MTDMKLAAEENYPLEPQIILDLAAQPAHNSFNRYLTFQDHTGLRKRLNIAFRKTGPLRWENAAFPDGIEVLKSLVDIGNRSYWDRMFLDYTESVSTSGNCVGLGVIRSLKQRFFPCI